MTDACAWEPLVSGFGSHCGRDLFVEFGETEAVKWGGSLGC